MKLQIHLLSIVLIVSAHAVAQTSNGSVYISKDRGMNWAVADNGFPPDGQVNAWLLKDGAVVAGTDSHGILISDDKLQSWYSSSKGLPKKTRIISIAVHNNILFAGTFRDGVFSSYDNGHSWSSCSAGMPRESVRAFLSLGSLLFAGTDSGIFISADGGKKWTNVVSGFQVNDFESYQKTILAATHKGVLMSDDGGSTWIPVGDTGAVADIDIEQRVVYIMDYSGNTFQAAIPSLVWVVTTDLYLPFHTTFKLTPASPRMFKGPWKNMINNLQGIQDVKRDGLPENVPFSPLLITPYGLLAGAIKTKC